MGFEVSKTIQQQLFGFEESTKTTNFNETKREVDEKERSRSNHNDKNNDQTDQTDQKNNKTAVTPDWERTLKLIRHGEYEEALRELQRAERSTSSSSSSHETTVSSTLTPRDVLIEFVRQRFFTAIRDDIPALAAPYAVLYVTLGADPHEAAQYIHVQSHSLWTKRFEPLILQLLSQLELTLPSNASTTVSSSLSSSILTQDPAHLRTTRPRPTPTLSSLTLTPAALLHQLYTTVTHYQITHTYIGDILGTKESLWLMAHAQSFVEHIALFVLHALRVSVQLDDLALEVDKTSFNVDLNTLTDLLDEFALISHHTEHYRLHLRKFYENGITRLREKGFSFVSENNQNKSENTLCITDYVQEPAALFTLLETLISRHYIPLEKTFFIRNFNKILRDEGDHVRSQQHCEEEEKKNKKPSGLFQNRERVITAIHPLPHTETSPSTSYLDDIFIVSDKCAERALSTLNVDAASRVLESLFSTLHGTFKDTLLQRLKEALESERTIRLGTRQQDTHLHITLLLNTFSMSTTFITTLYESVLKKLQRLFKSNLDDEKERIHRLVTRQGTHIAEDFQKVFHNAVDMFVQFVWAQLQVSLGCFGQLNYNFDQNQYKIYEINDPWVEAFAHSMQEVVVSPYRVFLCDEAWEEVIVCLLDVLLVDLERILMKKTYTYYGGLQLHNDIQQLFKYFSSLIKRTVRDRFTRLLQITSLLTLEKVSEVPDYWHTENMKWRLSPDEVREVLRRRKDFNSVAIDRLKLESTAEK